LTVATEFALIILSMPNFKLQKCDETDLMEYLPNIAQSIWGKTGLLVAELCISHTPYPPIGRSHAATGAQNSDPSPLSHPNKALTLPNF